MANFDEGAAILNPGIALTAVSGLSFILLLLGHGSASSYFLEAVDSIEVSQEGFYVLSYGTILLYLLGGILAIVSVDLHRPTVIATIVINLLVVVIGGLFTLAVVAPSLANCQKLEECESEWEEVILASLMVSILLVILSSFIAGVGFYLVLRGSAKSDYR